MISRRLTKIQKDEILEAYRGGENTNILAEKYSCSSNTINRTVKTLLSDMEYKLLKEKRLKSSNKKEELINNENVYGNQKDLDNSNSFNSPQNEVNEKEQSIKTEDNFLNSDFEEIAFLPIGDLSLSESQSNENLDIKRKELDFKIFNQEILPESVYMLVDKKVELEVKAISDLPEWSFLPENELKRNAILLFSNQRTAKRSCSRSQRVIKIPNTSIFKLSKTYLVSQGITRLILEDSIIALDD